MIVDGWLNVVVYHPLSTINNLLSTLNSGRTSFIFFDVFPEFFCILVDVHERFNESPV